VPCVRRGRDEPGELVQADAAADLVELAALLELVREVIASTGSFLPYSWSAAR
jgi:hypothetical protein